MGAALGYLWGLRYQQQIGWLQGTPDPIAPALDLARTLATGNQPGPELNLRSSHTGFVSIQLLPLTLFYHDAEIRLDQQLQPLLKGFAQTETHQAAVVSFCRSLAMILQEQFKPATCMADLQQTLEFSRWPERAVPPPPSRHAIPLNWVGGNSLDQVGAHLKQSQLAGCESIILALYCFGSTPEATDLVIKRAVQNRFTPAMTGALAGALAGGYNGVEGLPVNWRLGGVGHPLPEAWNLPDLSALLPLAAQLLAAWAGVLPHPDSPIGSPSSLSVAAPQVIRTLHW